MAGSGDMQTGGVLSAWDLALLDRHLAFYLALAEQRRAATTALQVHFVTVASGRARPGTQHEIAFHRHRHGWIDPRRRPEQLAQPSPIIRPTLRVERTVDWVDAAASASASKTSGKLLGDLRQLYTRGRARAERAGADAAVWVGTALSDPELGNRLGDWTSREFGRLSDVYTQAMDGSYIKGLVAGPDYVSPSLHRLFEGHTLPEAWRAVRSALPDDTLAQEFVGYLHALGSDLATKIGLPVMTLTPEQFDHLAAFVRDDLGLSRESMIDLLHLSAVEAMAVLIPAACAAMSWSRADGEAFARLAGGLAIGTAVAANPLMALLAVGMLAKAFHAVRHERELVRGVLEGSIVSGTVLATNAVIGGPVWLGLAVGVGFAIGIKRAVRSPAAAAMMATASRGRRLDELLGTMRSCLGRAGSMLCGLHPVR